MPVLFWNKLLKWSARHCETEEGSQHFCSVVLGIRKAWRFSWCGSEEFPKSSGKRWLQISQNKLNLPQVNIKRSGVFLELKFPVGILVRKHYEGWTDTNVMNGLVGDAGQDQRPELPTHPERGQADGTIGSNRKHNLFFISQLFLSTATGICAQPFRCQLRS